MPFQLLPVIDIMLDLYQKPRSFDRFQDYLKVLQGPVKGELSVPLGGFNPMAKEHVMRRLMELKDLHGEQIMETTLAELNAAMRGPASNVIFQVALNLSDDLQGGWTNRYTADYDSKFKLNALVSRGFCVPLFWVSEAFGEDMIRERTLEYCYRSLYWLEHPKPRTLKDHVEQERYVARIAGRLGAAIGKPAAERDGSAGEMHHETIVRFYETYKDTEDYSIIFNFFYGDKASRELGFAEYGIEAEIAGFRYVRRSVGLTG